MCYNCGCHNIQDDMGSSENITEQTFENLSRSWKKSLSDTKREVYELLKKELIENDKNALKDPHLIDMFTKASLAWGQDINEAKKNTYSILEEQFGK